MIKLTPALRDFFGTHGEPQPIKHNPPLFITGVMRSGTTYLVNKLAAHPQLLKIGAELNQIWGEIGGAPTINPCPHLTESDASAIYTYQMTNYFADYIRESKSLKRHLMRLVKRSETNLFRVKYDWDHLYPMNKTPHIMNKLRYVNALFPTSKFIIIVRDIYAHSASMKHHFLKAPLVNYMPSDGGSCWTISTKEELEKGIPNDRCFPPNFSLIPEMWIRMNSLALRELATIESSRCLVIRYEDLVMEETQTMQRVFAFLKLREEHQKEEQKISELAAKKRNTTTKGDPLKKWKTQLSSDEIDAIEKVISANSTEYEFVRLALES